MKEKPTIVVEFDGVICENKFPDVGEPIEGARDTLKKLKAAGYRIRIHSRRTSSYFKNFLISNQFQWIADYMEYYKLDYDDIWVPDKPVAVAYIDNKAVKFYKNWGEITEQINKNIRI